MNIPITPEMARALKIIKEHGSLMWFKGGFWHHPGAEMIEIPADRHTRAYSHPKDYVRTNTVKALNRRGYIWFPAQGHVLLHQDALTYSWREVVDIVRAELAKAGCDTHYSSINSPRLPCPSSPSAANRP